MKKSVVIVSALLIALLFDHSSQAGEREIRTLGGAFIGKWKFSDVEPADALLEVEREGRKLIKVRAGYVSNGRYAEYWQFEKWRLLYEALPTSGHYRVDEFRDKDGPKIFCGSDPSHCDFHRSEKVSQNLLIVQFRHRPSGRECAGLLYIGENFISEGSMSFGDYYAKSSACLSGEGGSDKALALSAHFLSLIKKDGRPIANLARYELPKLE